MIFQSSTELYFLSNYNVSKANCGSEKLKENDDASEGRSIIDGGIDRISFKHVKSGNDLRWK